MYNQSEINICVTDDDSEVDLEDDNEFEGKIFEYCYAKKLSKTLLLFFQMKITNHGVTDYSFLEYF